MSAEMDKMMADDRTASLMNGEHLYWRYVQLQSKLNNCGVDAWGDLDEEERQVWNALAESLAESP